MQEMITSRRSLKWNRLRTRPPLGSRSCSDVTLSPAAQTVRRERVRGRRPQHCTGDTPFGSTLIVAAMARDAAAAVLASALEAGTVELGSECFRFTPTVRAAGATAATAATVCSSPSSSSHSASTGSGFSKASSFGDFEAGLLRDVRLRLLLPPLPARLVSVRAAFEALLPPLLLALLLLCTDICAERTISATTATLAEHDVPLKQLGAQHPRPPRQTPRGQVRCRCCLRGHYLHRSSPPSSQQRQQHHVQSFASWTAAPRWTGRLPRQTSSLQHNAERVHASAMMRLHFFKSVEASTNPSNETICQMSQRR
jgi:hypothetical protein